jgi:hypothetical protein
MKTYTVHYLCVHMHTIRGAIRCPAVYSHDKIFFHVGLHTFHHLWHCNSNFSTMSPEFLYSHSLIVPIIFVLESIDVNTNRF